MPNGRNGDPALPTSKHWQHLDSIEFIIKAKPDFSMEIAEKYQNGYSVGELAKLYRCSKHKVLKDLKQRGVNTRPQVVFTTLEARRNKCKGGSKPYYGFCYFEGKLTKQPIEFPVLLKIHQLWVQERTVHQINLELNKLKIKSREGKKWSWAAIRNIVNRFKNKIVILKETGEFEIK